MKNILGLVAVVSLVSASALGATGKPQSVYTKLSCKVTQESTDNDPIDFFYSTCRGYAKYDLRHDGGDSRDWLSIVLNDAKNDLLVYPGYFPYVAAEKLEWRGLPKKNGGIEPYALIYRVRAQDPADESGQRTIDSLVVAHLSRTSACVLATIPATGNPQANAQARAAADANGLTECPDDE